MENLNGKKVILMETYEYNQLIYQWTNNEISIEYEEDGYFYINSQERNRDIDDKKVWEIIGKNLGIKVNNVIIDFTNVGMVVIIGD